MKNGDMTVMPIKDLIQDCGPDGSQGPFLREIEVGGLTKREYFAGIAMAGLVRDIVPEYCASRAIEYADALLVELEKTK